MNHDFAPNYKRSAEERLAHFFCEWNRRLQAVGLADEEGCELPLTQVELADTVGLSTVHVNRSLQALRERGLITVGRKRLVITDLEGLRSLCGFRSNYLHLEGTKPAE